MSLARAQEHSLAQLKLLGAAAARLQAREGLLRTDVVFAAVAAAMHQDNRPLLARLQSRLEAQATHG